MNFCDNKVCGRKSEESEKNTMLQQEDLIPKQEEAADVLKSKTLRRTSYASFLFSIALEVLLVAVVTTLMIIIWFFASKHAQHSVAVVSNNLRGEWLTYAKASTTSVLERNNASATHLANLMVSSLMKGNLSSYSTLEEQVHLMGGDINIIDKDEPGEQGTCFRFNLFFKRTSKKYAKSTNEIKQLSGIHPPDGASLQATFGSCDRFAIQDWQHGLKSESFTSSISEVEFYKSPPLVEGFHAILAMHGEAGKNILKKWLERRGVQVWMLSQLEDLVPTLENLRHEIFSNSFRSSSAFESVSREYHFSATRLDYGVEQPPTAGCGLTDEVVKQIEMNRVSNYLLVLLDIDMIVGPMEQVVMLLNKFSGSGQIPNYKVVWLATANTSCMDLEKLKGEMLPCDLILHKPIHGSRLHSIWELVQDLTRKIKLQPSEVKAPSILQQMPTSDEPRITTMGLDNRQDQSCTQLVSTQNNKKLRALSSLAGMHILVAEDNVVLQRLAKSMLVRLGATVECVYNGAEAVRLVSEALHNNMKGNKDIRSSEELSPEASTPANPYGFDILLMDCEMPEMDGYEATRRIRDEERCYGCRLPIIALTAHAMVEEEMRCFQAGMDFHLSKPLVMESLLNVITKILSK